MPVFIALLRGVNLAGHNRIKMDALRALCESLNLRDVQTYVQSGNIVFRTKDTDALKLAARLESAIEAQFGFRPAVILRTPGEWRDAIARNPFASRTGINPAALLVHFLAAELDPEAREKARAIPPTPEEVHIFDRELFIHFPNGMARPKLKFPVMERALKVTGSGRNWNTVLALLEMAERLEAVE
jgi:uncharacterized protein (DUF1697 family)